MCNSLWLSCLDFSLIKAESVTLHTFIVSNSFPRLWSNSRHCRISGKGKWGHTKYRRIPKCEEHKQGRVPKCSLPRKTLWNKLCLHVLCAVLSWVCTCIPAIILYITEFCFELFPRLCNLLRCCKAYHVDIGIHYILVWELYFTGYVICLYITELVLN